MIHNLETNKQTNKVLLVTYHKGFNYGTMLQAFAMKILLKECKFDPVIIYHKDGIIKGRDVTFSKLFIMAFRFLCHPIAYKKTINAFVKLYSLDVSENTKQKFLNFQKEFDVQKMSFSKMKKLSKKQEIKACVCGSDQIWKTDLLYVSPYYFLRFAPKNKRVSYAPSFGQTFVPSYNQKKFKKYINDFNFLSVREKSGVELIKKLTGRSSVCVLDPTLAIPTLKWLEIIKEKNIEYSEDFILLYFLDIPTQKTIDFIKKVQKENLLKVKAILYNFNEYNSLLDFEFIAAGPFEFLSLVKNAKIVFTDSFHATAFSTQFHTPFVSMNRNHGKNILSQQTRQKDFLNFVQLENRFENDDFSKIEDKLFDCDFSISDKILENARKESIEYLRNAIEGCSK
ncbi:polysaccharide pyruvyl transferase family protein [uncultured Treponema sp.]|uniref:polysaccharide pyruvyl transferase family protein n=1 Tax=uncultured Treponema sp. TaxID=162155 RepID=UPI0027D9CD13|nr:polysaccharide pyruvyl transferase family protein [uncultured Treponema sp.]